MTDVDASLVQFWILQGDSGNRLYSITARRNISGRVLN